MLISELDLCKREWLELVFAGRNKTYGAYELRRRYNGIMLRAVAATVFVVSAFAVTANIISHHKKVEVLNDPVILVKIDPPPPTIKKHDEVIKIKPVQPAGAMKATPISTKQYIPFVVKPDKDAPNPPEELKATDNPGQTTVNVPGNGVAPIVDASGDGNGNSGTGSGVTEDNGGVFLAVEDMPQPVGGPEAWAKFLQKNLRFPAMAQDAGVGGKVFLSFIIEKDGHLTDIKLVRKAGYGFDEEALRVLKLAPAWKPGKQNGSPVRVQYTIPINFQLNNDN